LKIDNIKEEVTQYGKPQKKNETEYKTQWKATPADQNKHKTESQNFKMKWKLMVKLKNCYSNNSKHVKGICKNSPTQKNKPENHGH
jgi:hypothetical protein